MLHADKYYNVLYRGCLKHVLEALHVNMLFGFMCVRSFQRHVGFELEVLTRSTVGKTTFPVLVDPRTARGKVGIPTCHAH